MLQCYGLVHLPIAAKREASTSVDVWGGSELTDLVVETTLRVKEFEERCVRLA